MAESSRDMDTLRAQQASAWLEVLKQPSAAQRIAFIAWLKESPQHVRDILLMIAVDEALAGLDAQHVHDVKALLAQAAEGRVVPFARRPAREGHHGAPRRPWRWPAVAAGLLAMGVVGWLWHAQAGSGWKEIQTNVGEQRAIELEDGSVVHLNTQSRVAFRLSPHAREVRLLAGEALFRVRHDAARPFRVYANNAVIEDVGTQFNVYNRSDGTVVAVLEGSVIVTPLVRGNATAVAGSRNETHARIAAGDRSGTVTAHTLNASQEVQISPAGEVTMLDVPDVADAVAWQQRRMVFRQQPLGYIVEQFNRYSRRMVRLEGASTESRVYTGVFDVDDPDSLAQVLARDPELVVAASDGGIVIRPR